MVLFVCSILFSDQFLSIISLLELGILNFSNSSLHLVKSLLHKCAILHVQYTVGIALDLGVVCDHDASGGGMLAIAVWSNSVDV